MWWCDVVVRCCDFCYFCGTRMHVYLLCCLFAIDAVFFQFLLLELLHPHECLTVIVFICDRCGGVVVRCGVLILILMSGVRTHARTHAS